MFGESRKSVKAPIRHYQRSIFYCFSIVCNYDLVNITLLDLLIAKSEACRVGNENYLGFMIFEKQSLNKRSKYFSLQARDLVLLTPVVLNYHRYFVFEAFLDIW